MNESEIVLDALDSREPVQIRRGIFVGIINGAPTVDMGSFRFPVTFAGFIPVVGDPVQVLSAGSNHLLFPVTAQPRVGTVTAVSSPRVTVQTATGLVTAIIVGAAPSFGDRVLLEWTEDGAVTVGKLATTVTPPVAPPDPNGGASQQTATFYAIDSGSTDRGSARWWTDQPWASDSTYGAWFYGNQIKDTIPATAVFVSLEFYVSYQQRQGGAPRIALHNAGTKGPLPAFAPYADWDPRASDGSVQDGFYVPPAPSGWFAALKQGGAYAGVGLDQGGFNKFSSLAQDRASGALRITWRK